MSQAPKLFRVTLEVADLERAAQLYATLFGVDGQRHPGGRHYFNCGGVILAVLDPTQGGLSPSPLPKSLYFAPAELETVHGRARSLGALAPYPVHGQPASD